MESNQSSAPLSLALAERFPQGLESPIPDQLKEVLETLIKLWKTLVSLDILQWIHVTEIMI